MGACNQGSGTDAMDNSEQHAAFDLNLLAEREALLKRYRPDSLCDFSMLIGSLSAERQKVREVLEQPKDVLEDRCIGAFLGLAIGDALGAPLEFASLRYDSAELKEMGQAQIWDVHPEFPEKRPIRNKLGYNYFGLKAGQWTDDTAMALCLADSLLVKRRLEPLDLRLRFLNWWHFGYNCAFKRDAERRRCEWCSSVGLGGNIGESLGEFLNEQNEYTATGSRLTSGNGSLMRLAPCAIFCRTDLTEALRIAAMQSRTTHQGEEAADCCRLLAHLLVGAFQNRSHASEGNHPCELPAIQNRRLTAKAPDRKAIGHSSKPATGKSREAAQAFKRWLLCDWIASFEAQLASVQCLARSEVETVPTLESMGKLDSGKYVVAVQSLDVKSMNMACSSVVGQLPRGTEIHIEVVMSGYGRIKHPLAGWVNGFDKEGAVLLEKPGWQAERNWNWRSAEFRYAAGRAAANLDYIGSYAMDCLAMSLHCVWTTDTFSAAVLKAANMCGDSDTVAAVTGQVAGAIYGAASVPGKWRKHLERWDDGNIALKAWLLFHREDDRLLSRAVGAPLSDVTNKASVEL
eukprot:gnl/TRDRNA2_/TRDRNA2_184581_c0_seq1.p1 gnl/TRDRNA2_/TRDRNA2_184581_c0~~gnl/TRDRNA2_/TRDRNA2_184581_c0_seq1.p1  ORF type:complete len:573 (+),score=97.45 gnl/TRDRNA2_/TRDRNA2_184581_c0_seq1:76-1794(+)